MERVWCVFLKFKFIVKHGFVFLGELCALCVLPGVACLLGGMLDGMGWDGMVCCAVLCCD